MMNMYVNRPNWERAMWGYKKDYYASKFGVPIYKTQDKTLNILKHVLYYSGWTLESKIFHYKRTSKSNLSSSYQHYKKIMK